MREEILGVLCSGRGTNLQSIIAAIDAGEINAKIAVVIADKPDAAALSRAQNAGIKNICIDFKKFAERKDFEAALVEELRANGVTLVILAGFMRLLGKTFLREYGGRTMNIHPALLPSFAGAHAHRDALRYGVKISGCTVHFVDEGMDTGPIILQAAVPVAENDTEETLAARILVEEHKIYPQAIKLYCDGRIKTDGRRVEILEQ